MIINSVINNDKLNHNIRIEFNRKKVPQGSKRNNLSKDIISFRGEPLTLIYVAAKGTRAGLDGWNFIKKSKLLLELQKVIEHTYEYTPDTLSKTLITLTKIQNKDYESVSTLVPVYPIDYLRVKAGEKDFLKELDDNIPKYKHAKRDFFLDFFNNAYSFNSNISADGYVSLPPEVHIDLTALSDVHHKDLKESIAETCLYSKSYVEKKKNNEISAFDHITNIFDSKHLANTEHDIETYYVAKDAYTVISGFDKNIYKDFLIKNADAYQEKLHIIKEYCKDDEFNLFEKLRRGVNSEIEFMEKLIKAKNLIGKIEAEKQSIKNNQIAPKLLDPIQLEKEKKSAKIPNCIMIVGSDSKINEELILWAGQKVNGRFTQIDHDDNILGHLKKAEEKYRGTGDRSLIYINNFEKLINPSITPGHVIADLKNLMTKTSEKYHSTIIFSTQDASKLDNIAIQPHRVEKIDANIKEE